MISFSFDSAYLYDEKCELSARQFCEESRYMHDENNLLKLGLRIRKIRQPISLYDLHKFYIDVQDLGKLYFLIFCFMGKIMNYFLLNEFSVFDVFVNELSDYVQTPQFEKLDAFEKVKLWRRLNRAKMKKCKCACDCARRSTDPLIPTLKRRLSATVTNEEMGQLFPTATVEQDLPGNRPSEKRRKLHDVRLLFPSRGDEPTTSAEFDNVKTPAKISMCLPSSVSKTPGIPGDILTNSMLNFDFQNILAESINNAFDGRSSLSGQLENALPTILANTEQNPTYDEIVFEAIQFQNTNNFGFDGFNSNSMGSTSTPSKCSGTEDVVDDLIADRPLNTPEPINESIKQRLRPRKSNTSYQTNETKRISKAKEIYVLSNETIVGPAEPVEENVDDVIVLNSDSEETVTTTSIQPLQLAQPTYLLKFCPNEQNFQLEIPTHPTGEQMQTLQNNLNIPIVFDSASYPMQAFIVDPQTLVNPNEFQANQFFINPALGSVQLESVEESRNRIISIDVNEVKADNNNQQIVCTEEQPTFTQVILAEEKVTQNIDKSLAQTKQTVAESKIGTPKEQMRPNNIPSSSRSLSTPRRRNQHVRVLDFTTPARFPLAEIAEAKNESSSVFNAITPQNQTITSSIPSSAPAKMSACVDSTKAKIINTIEPIAEESSSVDSAIPFGQENDEDTVISVGSDTPKVRKKGRRACVRSLSKHKEINVTENVERFKRVAKTKKKICAGSDNSNDGQKIEEPINVKKDDELKLDAAEEWRRQREMAKNPMYFEQTLRENESKKQARITAEAPKRRKKRPQQKSAAKTKKKPVKKSAEISTEKLIEQSTEQLNESCKSTDISLNSSLDTTLNSTQLKLEAKLLEDNLASAKKATPAKSTTPKIKKKKKTPAKVHIKLMPSPKVKLIAKLKKTPLKKLTIKAQTKSAEPDQNVDAAKIKEIEVENVTDQPAVTATLVDSTLSNKSTQEDLEAAKELLNMQTIILQQEKDKVKDDLSDFVFPSTSKITEILPTADTRSQLKDSDMASLETPFKNESGAPLFPRTPGINNILHSMATPIIKPGMSFLDVSMLKNSHLFPTPNVPITPGFTFTPLKDLISPRGDQDLIYGAANRPTDYSSSSSYYKPDESDGIDKQIHASIRSTRTNSSAYSADEFDYSQKDNFDAALHDESNSKLNSSSSSSSSSSDSDSESDTSSSSSDSNASQIDINVQPTNVIEQTNLKEELRSTEGIKSHLVSTQVGIAQNILLAEPQSPIADKEAEQAETLALMESKRLRIQEKMRQDTQKVTKSKTASKNLISTVKRIERFRMPTIATRSPSKRKSTLPQRFVPQTKASAVIKETQSIITQQMISEAISDNAIVDASDVSIIKKIDKVPSHSENIDAIAEHIRQISNNKDIEVEMHVKVDAKKMSGKRLIGILEGKRKAKTDQIKAQFIEALPVKKPKRSRPKTIINPIAPKQNVQKEPMVKQPIVSISTSKASNEQPKQVQTEPKPSAEIVTALTKSKPKDNFKTPAKERRKQHIRDIFGDMTDIETPIKSPPRKPVVSKEVQTSQASNTSETKPKNEPQPSLANSLEKDNDGNADKMNASMSSLSTDDYSSDEDEMELVFSIDETDKKRFQFVQETWNSMPPMKKETVRIPNLHNFKRTIVIDDEKVILTIDPEDELFAQNSKPVAVTDTKKKQSKNIPKAISPSTETKQCNELLDSSTPSSFKQTPLSPKPKFNIKHKNKDPKKEDR